MDSELKTCAKNKKSVRVIIINIVSINKYNSEIFLTTNFLP
jgi:hypothetical protein